MTTFEKDRLPNLRRLRIIRAPVKRVLSHCFDVYERQWRVELACGHTINLVEDYHAYNVVARWCPRCDP